MDQDYTFIEAEGAGADAPLIFLFHGTGGNEHQFFDVAAQLLPGARRVAIRGDVSEGGALRYFRRTGEGVYDMADLAVRTGKMAAFLRGQIGATRPRQVVGLGYSNGANILASVLFAAPELFDKAVLLHPLIPFVPAPQPDLSGRSVLITAGRRDQICPAPMTEALVAWFEAQGAGVAETWHEGGHEIRQEEWQAAQAFLAA